jgi:hypothetical protein
MVATPVAVGELKPLILGCEVLLLGKNVYIVLVDLKNASSSVLSALYI